MCKVSVIVPTYKRRDQLQVTLGSVFAQTFTDYEVIVVNDGSPDDTRNVLAPLVKSGKIRYIEQENAGQASARNHGLKEARGTYTAFLDDDDLWPPDKLDWQVRAMEAEDQAVLVYGNAQYFTEETDSGGVPERRLGQIVPSSKAPVGWVWDSFVAKNYIQSPGQTLVLTEAARAIGGFDRSIWGTEDYDFHIRLARKGRFVYEDRLALLYRFQAVSTSRNITKMYANVIKVRRKHLGLIPRPSTLHLWLANCSYVSDVWGDDFVNAAGDALRRGDKKQARRLWLRAVSLRPAFLGRRHTYYLLKNLI